MEAFGVMTKHEMATLTDALTILIAQTIAPEPPPAVECYVKALLLHIDGETDAANALLLHIGATVDVQEISQEIRDCLMRVADALVALGETL